MSTLFDLSGKTAVVTGGSGLLGQALCRGLAEHGAKVYSADIDDDQNRKITEGLQKQNLDVSPVSIDISEDVSIKNAILSVQENSKSIDIWINNAYPRTADWGDQLADVKSDSWRKNVDHHLNGYCLCSKQIGEVMKSQKKGSIINMASIYGMNAPDFSLYEGTDMTMPAAYSAIKGGVLNFTKYLSALHGKDGVRVNAISPGGIYDAQPESFVEKYVARTPLGRMAKAEDVVGAIVYLSSDASNYVTGHNLVVDGGWTAV